MEKQISPSVTFVAKRRIRFVLKLTSLTMLNSNIILNQNLFILSKLCHMFENGWQYRVKRF